MSRFQNVDIKARDSPSVDPFGRWRVSNPTTLFDSKQIFDNQPLLWDELLVGLGITTAHSVNTASTVFTSTVNTAGTFTRQTFMRHNYQPGKGQLIYMTGTLQRSGGGAGVERRVGLFDDENGLFFADIEGTMNVVRRTFVTGAAVDNAVPRNQWNVDQLDGNGPSGVTVDFSLAQIFCIDFEWLGVGRVRFGVIIDGMIIICHEFLNANLLSLVFMSTPNLPLRWQIITTGVSPASTMEAMCGTVISEGGAQATGILRYFSTSGLHIDATTINIVFAVAGIRLKAANLGARIVIENISMINQQAQDFEWLLLLNPVVAVAITFTAQANSNVETGPGTAFDPSTSTLTGGTVIGGGFVKSSNQGAGDISMNTPNALLLGADIAGAPDEIYLGVRPLAANADIEGSITWRESP